MRRLGVQGLIFFQLGEPPILHDAIVDCRIPFFRAVCCVASGVRRLTPAHAVWSMPHMPTIEHIIVNTEFHVLHSICDLAEENHKFNKAEVIVFGFMPIEDPRGTRDLDVVRERAVARYYYYRWESDFCSKNIANKVYPGMCDAGMARVPGGRDRAAIQDPTPTGFRKRRAVMVGTPVARRGTSARLS
ncbi:unnamed protein product [Trichogramma brassicae]|uniref:Uncharacterized protein n=1 Tax=Trichogramma brassicae TaxID=86971 RepID=A0A6H5I2K4_9HYME|nr:unnamed protein product [Trichogramma brassicae]